MEIAHASPTHGGKVPARYAEQGASFPAYLDRIKQEIDERIMHIVSGPAGWSIDRRLEAQLRHGKRMRAGLLMLTYDTFNQGKGRDMALDLASAVEIAHASSLIVDDMLDEDDTRHGMPALHLTAGHKGAILGTIGILSYPYQIASRYGEGCVLALARTHRAMVRGATRELRSVSSAGVGQAYESIIENKTGALFSLTTEYGAIAAGCPPGRTRTWADFGMLTGKAMQVADDVSDLESLLSGRRSSLGGSEALLLRCCLCQTGEHQDVLDVDAQAPVRPIGTERRKDIEDIMNRYLDAAIRCAVEAAHKLPPVRQRVGKVGTDQAFPELENIPTEIAAMVLNERN